ncbi:MAG: hypothetical protein U1B83_07610 [Candidatus Cloacimonadaceae bacterium]|nr:hypothetical protein [Candidatus Cloacimonadaceae bacterium]
MTHFLSLILPALKGTLSISLNDHQLNSLVEGILRDKSSLIHSVKSGSGYLELNIALPLIGSKSINVAIESIEVRSNLLRVRLHLLNVWRLLVKGLVALLRKQGIESHLEAEFLILDLSDKWKTAVSQIPEEARSKLNSLEITTAFSTEKAEISLKIT